jgi:hypothetical protein
MRRSTLALAAILGFSCAAHAQCSDTLYLQSIMVYRQTLHNDSVLKAWDSTTVNPWSSADLLQAGPLGYSVLNLSADSVEHFLRFKSNCPPDSVSDILVSRIRDTLTQVRLSLVHQISVDTFIASEHVDRKGDGSTILTYPANYPLYFIWQSPDFQVGLAPGGSAIEGWSSVCRYYTFKSPQTNIYTLSSPIVPIRQVVLDSISSCLSASQVGAVGHGTDSVRTELVMYHYTYDFDPPTSAIRSRDALNQNFLARSIAQGVEIRIDHAAQVQVIGLDGKMATSFAVHVGTNLWDGRGASGNRLTGLWIVRAEGVGAVPVVLR